MSLDKQYTSKTVLKYSYAHIDHINSENTEKFIYAHTSNFLVYNIVLK